MARNAKDIEDDPITRLLLVGPTGSGKTCQWWSLRGKKFGYIFDPNTMKTLRGLDIDVEEFYPDILEVDATLKGFNKGSKDDTMGGSKREPTVYMDWVEDINEKVESGFFVQNKYDWLGFDSLTFLVRAVMDRQLYINNRYGGIEELGDYRIVGSKLSQVFNSIMSLPINIFATGHIDTFQDEKTHRINTQLRLPGSARAILPLIFTDIWKTQVYETEDGKRGFEVVTVPEPKGLQDIRCSIPGLDAVEDVTISDFNTATEQGVQALLDRGKPAGVAKKRARK